MCFSVASHSAYCLRWSRVVPASVVCPATDRPEEPGDDEPELGTNCPKLKQLVLKVTAKARNAAGIGAFIISTPGEGGRRAIR